MPKKLIVCADGTWNPVEKLDGGARISTNVARVAAFLLPQDEKGNRQLVCYLEGVGTKEEESVSGGAFGWGLSANIETAYRFLARNFVPGDELYFFGFSRGAFTARSLAGLIHNCGIVRNDSPTLVDAAMALYRDRRDETEPDSIRARVFRRQNSHETGIRFIGVWDTVGSLGTPLLKHKLAKALGWDWRFHDTTLGPHIQHAVHALAIHETRSKFLPTLWVRPPTAPANQVLEQMWFCGCHSDVGGGYVETELSDIGLEWMIGRAEFCGLRFEPHWRQIKLGKGQAFHSDYAGRIHSEFRGLWPYLDAAKGCPLGACRRLRNPCLQGPPQPRASSNGRLGPSLVERLTRPIRPWLIEKNKPVDGQTFEAIHPSVIERRRLKIDGDWWPPDFAAAIDQAIAEDEASRSGEAPSGTTPIPP